MEASTQSYRGSNSRNYPDKFITNTRQCLFICGSIPSCVAYVWGINQVILETLSTFLFPYFFITIGNSNLIYQIIRKRTAFHQLANLSTDQASINKVVSKRGKKPSTMPASSPSTDSLSASSSQSQPSTSHSAADQGTLKATLAATPGIVKGIETSYEYVGVFPTFTLSGTELKNIEWN